MMTSTTGLRVEQAGARRRSAGFTLLELVLVMLIMCTVLGMAAPSLRGFFASRKTADAATQIVALTQLARSLAVCEGRLYRLNVDCESGSYWLTAQRFGAFERVKRDYGRTFLLPDGTACELERDDDVASRDYIQFYPDGSQDAATIVLADRQGSTLAIACPSPAESFSVQVSEN